LYYLEMQNLIFYGEIIAIDGKTLCNSMDLENFSSAIHMVSAFATQARLVLAQQKVDEKSNEITAIPKLLDLLDLNGHIVTIDAIGTQKAIAKKIVEKGGDYVLALKGNQGTLNEDVRLFLETELKKNSSKIIEDHFEETDKGYGRLEIRKCFVSSKIDWLNQKEQWVGLKTIAMAARNHWLIENGLHWTLDVVFNEDNARVRKDNAGENMAIIRHVTLNMLNNAKKSFKNIALKALRKNAGWSNETLDFILKQNFKYVE